MALLAASALGAGSVMAAVDPQVINVNLQYSKAELASPDGAERLYRRIQYAARQACGAADSRELKRYFLTKSCYQRAVDNAVAKVDAPALTALHRAQTQRAS